jgi:hypothetical protein
MKSITQTVRISEEELIRYVATLEHVGHTPSSKGDIFKSICRLWMNEYWNEHIIINERHRRYVTKDKSCSDHTPLSAPVETKTWLNNFPLEQQKAATNVHAYLTTTTKSNKSEVERVLENLSDEDEKIRSITQKLVELNLVERPYDGMVLPKEEPTPPEQPLRTDISKIRLISDEEKQAIKDKEERDLKAMMEQFNNGKALPEEEE